jgi:hypothetical protein
MVKRGSKVSNSPAKRAASGPKTTTDWRPGMVSRLRRLIQEADPEAVEEQKWKKPSNPAGVPVWYHDGIVCLVNELKGRVRLTFPGGSQLDDKKGLFNATLDANWMRGIDIPEGAEVDADGIKSLVRAAVTRNVAKARERR